MTRVIKVIKEIKVDRVVEVRCEVPVDMCVEKLVEVAKPYPVEVVREKVVEIVVETLMVEQARCCRDAAEVLWKCSRDAGEMLAEMRP